MLYQSVFNNAYKVNSWIIIVCPGTIEQNIVIFYVKSDALNSS